MICNARPSCANDTALPVLSVLLPVLWFCWVAVPSCVPADAPPAAWSLPPQAARDTVIPAASINAHNFLFHLLIIFSYSSDPLFSNRNHLKSKLQPGRKTNVTFCSPVTFCIRNRISRYSPLCGKGSTCVSPLLNRNCIVLCCRGVLPHMTMLSVPSVPKSISLNSRETLLPICSMASAALTKLSP